MIKVPIIKRQDELTRGIGDNKLSRDCPGVVSYVTITNLILRLSRSLHNLDNLVPSRFGAGTSGISFKPVDIPETV